MSFPVDHILDQIIPALTAYPQVLLSAPPGAGKSTRLPLYLLKHWQGTGKIIMLEPRRIAARSLASFMSSQLNEKVGETVGYRIRQDTKVSAKTRLEIVTEGVLTRMLQADPMLEDVSMVIFDEFHERHMQSDLALALCLDVQQGLRDDLALIVMSATLDEQALTKMLPQATPIKSEGRSFPVDIAYQPAPSRFELVDTVCQRVLASLQQHEGNILCFLPGKGEISRIENQLRQKVSKDVLIAPLYGDLSMDMQQKAISAPTQGMRKVVLATNIAETSLTIEGISVVIDAGLERRAQFQPAIQMNRLLTRFVSKASATQRAGRAGRLMAGHCYRLWSDTQQQSLVSQIPAEISEADLTSLALELACWQVEAAQLSWPTMPPEGRLQAAYNLLGDMGCVIDGKISQYGRDVAAIPTHPRYAHALLQCMSSFPKLVSLTALCIALLEQKDIGEFGHADFSERIHLALSSQSRYSYIFHDAKRLLRGLPAASWRQPEHPDESEVAIVLVLMFPDRIAKNRGKGRFTLANGKGAKFYDNDALSQQPWIIVADATGQGSEDIIIRRAIRVEIDDVCRHFSNLVKQVDIANWDTKTGRFVSESQQRIGKLTLSSQRSDHELSASQRIDGLIDCIKQNNLSLLKINNDVQIFINRCVLAAKLSPQLNIADFSLAGLVASADEWLAPYVQDIKHLSKLANVDMLAALKTRIDWNTLSELDRLYPEKLNVASGNRYRIDYLTDTDKPRLSCKLQEMFGQPTSPTIADGQCPLLLELLAPNGRPLQLTMDLASFWENGYDGVKKEMRGRYPKHPWPDDPIAALPTNKTNFKLRQQGKI